MTFSAIIKAAIPIILYGITAAVFTGCIIGQRIEDAAVCLLTAVLMALPHITEKKIGVALPDTLKTVLMCFAFCANILGEIGSFYERIVIWDSLLHTLNGFICAAIGFGLSDILNRTEKVRLSPVFVCLFAFCFSMTVGVVWEFTEFAIDSLFAKDMQKDTVINAIHTVLLSGGSNEVTTIGGITDVSVNSQSLGVGGYIDIGLIDTMKDLFSNLVGSALFIILGYVYLKSNRTNWLFAEHFMPSEYRGMTNKTTV